MAKIPLTEGFYEARSLIADAQKCVNLFPEVNPKDAEQPATLYPTPGMGIIQTAVGFTPVATNASQQGSLSGWRGMYMASNGTVYGVCGNSLYTIDQLSLALTLIGTMSSTWGTPVKMKDNGTFLFIVDGFGGYQVTLTTNAFIQITDVNFLGGQFVDYVDTFIVTNIVGTQSFQSTHSNSNTWDALFVAAKTGEPDQLRALAITHREIWLFGNQSTEVWYNVGGATFPFALLPGIFLQQGIAVPYTLATYDTLLFWLGRNANGELVVYQSKSYQAFRISTHAIEKEISSYSMLSDAFAYTYQQEGHVFYVLSFPTMNKTWVFDLSSQKWHQRAWYNTTTGQQELWRPSCMVLFNLSDSVLVAGDWQNGNLYQVDLDLYQDFGGPILRQKSYPHLIEDGKRIHYAQFSADMEQGGMDPTVTDPAWISLRWSDDRGASYGNPMLQTMGQGGQFLTQSKWNRLGMARDRVFELSWSINAKTALSGAFLDTVPFGS